MQQTIHAKPSSSTVVNSNLHALFELILTSVMIYLSFTSWPPKSIALPLTSGNYSSRPPTVTTHSSQPTTRRRKRACESNGSDDNSESSNPKRKRNSKYHPDRAHCLPCAIWEQSGGDPHLLEFHPLKDSRHAGLDALSLSQYASFHNINFNLESNDCICEPCYRDFNRNKNNKENTIPRWAKIRNDFYTRQVQQRKHCIYCCGSVCDCRRINQWGPDNWYGDDSISTWKQYLSLRGVVDYAISDHINHICRTHYRRIFELKCSRECITCQSRQSSKWKLVCNIANSPENICESFSHELGSIHFFDWICDQCCLCFSNDQRLETELTSAAQSQDQLKAKRSSLLLRTLDTLKTDGIVFTKDVINEFKEILFELNIDSTCHARLCNTLTKYLSSLSNGRFKMCIPPEGGDGLGRALFDESKHSIPSISCMFKMKKREWEGQRKQIGLKKLQQLIKKQTLRFPTSGTFDYTQTIKDGSMELNSYFEPELVQFIDTITKPTCSSNTSKLYQHLRHSRVHMIIALLCFTMNPTCCFIQRTPMLCIRATGQGI